MNPEKYFSEKLKKNLQVNKKCVSLQPISETGWSSLIYFRMDARRGSDEGGSYLMVMTDEERAQRSSRRKETKRSSLTSLREIRGKARKQIEKIKSVI